MKLFRDFWSYFSECWYAMKYSYLLAVRDSRIDALKEELKAERARRQSLERILADSVIHPNHDPHQCVLRENDQ
jgi:hypothetical protein